jgi:hypothetical protein
MAEENEHVTNLIKARTALVTQRRELAKAISQPNAKMENLVGSFATVLSAIKAIDEEALTDERKMAGSGEKPQTFPNPFHVGTSRQIPRQ